MGPCEGLGQGKVDKGGVRAKGPGVWASHEVMGPDAMTLVIPLHILHVFCNEHVSVLKVLKRRIKVLKNTLKIN